MDFARRTHTTMRITYPKYALSKVLHPHAHQGANVAIVTNTHWLDVGMGLPRTGGWEPRPWSPSRSNT